MNALNGYDYEDLELGMTASFAKTLTDADIALRGEAVLRLPMNPHSR